MKMNEYQTLAQRTSNTKTSKDKEINGLLGLNGEVGEITDLYKKHLFQGHSFELTKAVEELGDVLWYIAELATGMGVDLGHVAEVNIGKLKKRYPEGFESEKSINREVKTWIEVASSVSGEPKIRY